MSHPGHRFTIRFWGVRGSIPTPGPSTVRYGGNTSCVSVEGQYIDGSSLVGILDAGTGIRTLGNELVNDDRDILLLLTHTHWDHIQGFPFFAPLRQSNRNIYLSRTERERGLFQLLLDQMDGRAFPLTSSKIPANITSFEPPKIQRREALGYHIQRLRANHPGETYGFRANLSGSSLIYFPDNEIYPPDKPHISFEEMVAFCKDADILIHDAQYQEDDLPLKWGWGHSVVSQVRELAQAASVKHLVLFHHDPERTDEELDAIQEESNAWFAQHAPATRCTVAYEGLTLTLP